MQLQTWTMAKQILQHKQVHSPILGLLLACAVCFELTLTSLQRHSQVLQVHRF